MAEKIFPPAKPTAVKAKADVPASSFTNVQPSFAANKPQPYKAARPVYRSHPHRSRRSCYCYCCLWIICILLLVIIFFFIIAGVLFFVYRPHRPSFTISSLHVSQLNLTSSSQLTTRFNLTVIARNPNTKIAFYYDPVSVSINSKGVEIGDGSITAFVTAKKSTRTLRTVVRRQSVVVNGDLKSDLKEKKNLPLKIEMDAKVKVKIGSHKSRKAQVRVVCNGIKVVAPTGESQTTATTSNAKCKVYLRIKLWRWTI